jgi:hypothetical protein
MSSHAADRADATIARIETKTAPRFRSAVPCLP